MAIFRGTVSDTANTPPPIETYPDESGSDSNTIVNAVVGGIAGLVLGFVPGSPILCGAIAGYLEGGDPMDGVTIGTLAGLIMLVPFLFLGLFLSMFVLGFGSGMFAVLLVGLLLFSTIYTVGLSIAGACIGIFLESEL